MNNLYFSGIKAFPIVKSKAFNSVVSKSCHPLCSVTILIEKFDFLSLHTSSNRFRFGPPVPRPTTYRQPVDWLPFEWHRRPKFSLYLQSGDLIKENPVDPNLPKLDFELSEELKTANETVRNTFTLATASKGEAKEVYTRNLLKRIQRHPFDYDSLEVKIALKTIQIRSLFEHHSRMWRKEIKISRIVLPIIIQKRGKLLKRLWEIDEARLNWLLEELQLTYTPPKMGVKLERYCKKWDLRRLTREYCEKIVNDKKAAYHEELKKEQQEFIEEKKKILAWIEEEEKALKSECNL